MNKTLPNARNQNIIEQELNGELLVYDLTINKAYTLNETLRAVYKACDGRTSFDELKRRHGFSDDLINLALDDLRKNELLEESYPSPLAGTSRREVIRRIGLASMVSLPLITGLIAPTAASAQSQSGGASCVPQNQCFPRGTVYCPPGCTGTYTFLSYPSSNATCAGNAFSQQVDCAQRQNIMSGVDFQRIS